MITNEQILQESLAAFNKNTGPRVGDFLRLPRIDPRAPEFTRFTHHWGDAIQTGGSIFGSYYLSPSGQLSYSGGLDPQIPIADIVSTDETMDGRIWFFNQGIAGAGRGVEFMAPMRVFNLRPGADTSPLWSMNTGYHLSVAAPSSYRYRFNISFRGAPETSFSEEHEVLHWLEKQNFRIAKPISQSQRILWPAEVTA